jgi:cysteine desulfurase family protein
MIYFDNAASTLQKPGKVIEAVSNCLSGYCANPGRSAHKPSLLASRVVNDTREAIAGFFGISDPLRVIFTSGATESLNIAIKGSLKKGDHVITTSMEHNSVLRPLSRLKEDGVEVTIVECSSEGLIDVSDIEKSIKPNTKMVICLHASNVTGTIMPIKEIGLICRKQGVLFLVDAAQSAGFLDIDVGEMNIDMLAVPGHKCLMGIQGIGFLYIGDRANPTQLIEGGTGSGASLITQPEAIPDKYESGTLNLPGIVSLNAAISYINEVGLAEIRTHELNLTRLFLENVRKINGAVIYGHNNLTTAATATVAMNLNNVSSSEFAAILDEEFDICTRAGLHCAPSAHKTIGTQESAAVRFSFGFFNTEAEIKKCIDAVYEISKR